MSTAIVAGPAAQIDAVAALLRTCGFDVTVVAGDGPEGVPDAVRVLTEGVMGPVAAGGVSVGVVCQADSAEQTLTALRPETPSAVSLSLLADAAPDLPFAEWRDEIMSATSDRARSYLGWTTADGRRRAVVLSGSVLSPLPEPDHGQASLAWGEPGPGAVALAESILSDALGMPDPMRSESSPSRLAAEISEAFAEEVVMHLPLDSFELSAAEVAGWGRRHLRVDDRQLVASGASGLR